MCHGSFYILCKVACYACHIASDLAFALTAPRIYYVSREVQRLAVSCVIPMLIRILNACGLHHTTPCNCNNPIVLVSNESGDHWYVAHTGSIRQQATCYLRGFLDSSCPLPTKLTVRQRMLKAHKAHSHPDQSSERCG